MTPETKGITVIRLESCAFTLSPIKMTVLKSTVALNVLFPAPLASPIISISYPPTENLVGLAYLDSQNLSASRSSGSLDILKIWTISDKEFAMEPRYFVASGLFKAPCVFCFGGNVPRAYWGLSGFLHPDVHSPIGPWYLGPLSILIFVGPPHLEQVIGSIFPPILCSSLLFLLISENDTPQIELSIFPMRPLISPRLLWPLSFLRGAV